MALKGIDGWRKKIDLIDRKINGLLSQRAKYALKIGEYKKKNRMMVYVQKREQEVLRKIEGNNRGPLTGTAIRNIFKAIMRESRKLQKKNIK